MAKPEIPAPQKAPEQTNIPVAAKKAPVHLALHCREDDAGQFVVVEVAYSTDAPAKETILSRHAAAAVAILAMEREFKALKMMLLHPTRFKTRASVLSVT